MAIAIFRGRNYCMAVRGKADSIWPILIKMTPGRFLFDYQSLLDGTANINNKSVHERLSALSKSRKTRILNRPNTIDQQI